MTKGETLELREPITKDDLVAEVCLNTSLCLNSVLFSVFGNF